MKKFLLFKPTINILKIFQKMRAFLLNSREIFYK